MSAPPLDQPYVAAPAGEAWRRFWKKGVTFSGRASRSEYWKAYFLWIAVLFGLYFLASGLTLAGNYGPMVLYHLGLAFSWAPLIWLIVTLLPILAVLVRRLHDANYSGGFYFVALIPFVGGIILFVLLAQASNPAGARFDNLGASGAQPRPLPPMPPSGSAGRLATPPPPPPPAAAETSWGATPTPPPRTPGSVDAPASLHAAPMPPAFQQPQPEPQPRGAADAMVSGIPGLVSAPPPPPPTISDELDVTRRAAPTGTWTVELPDGRRLAVASDLYIGRDPVAEPDRGVATLVPIDDQTKSMSKTHARVTASADAVEVVDLHSTNGTRVTPPGGPAISLRSGVAHRIDTESTVSFGDYIVTVRPSSFG